MLGTPLPDDYKEYVARYGSGVIDDFLVVLNPFAANPNIRLVDAGAERRQALEELRSGFPLEYRHDVYPRPGGLLPFAITDNANVFYWKTAGEPNSWTVAVYEGRGPAFAEYAGGMAACLRALLERAVRLDVLPAGFPGRAPAFVPLG